MALLDSTTELHRVLTHTDPRTVTRDADDHRLTRRTDGWVCVDHGETMHDLVARATKKVPA